MSQTKTISFSYSFLKVLLKDSAKNPSSALSLKFLIIDCFEELCTILKAQQGQFFHLIYPGTYSICPSTSYADTILPLMSYFHAL